VLLNASTDVDGNVRPKAGDRTFCIHCGAGLVYETAGGNLRPMTQAEFDDTVRNLNQAEREVMQALLINRQRERN